MAIEALESALSHAAAAAAGGGNNTGKGVLDRAPAATIAKAPPGTAAQATAACVHSGMPYYCSYCYYLLFVHYSLAKGAAAFEKGAGSEGRKLGPRLA